MKLVVDVDKIISNLTKLSSDTDSFNNSCNSFNSSSYSCVINKINSCITSYKKDIYNDLKKISNSSSEYLELVDDCCSKYQNNEEKTKEISIDKISNILSSSSDIVNFEGTASTKLTGLPSTKLKSSIGEPDWTNMDAWGSNNPYSDGNLGQCVWFAWGKFYEIYGYDPGFRGWGNECASQLVNSHPDKFTLSDTPKVGAVFSYTTTPHVGIVTAVNDDGTVTIFDGNYNGSNEASIEQASADCSFRTVSLSELSSYGTVYANPIS